MSLISCVEKLDKLRFRKTIPSARSVPVERMAVIDNMVTVLLKDGSIWTNWTALRQFCLCPGNWNGKIDRFLRTLAALGLVKGAEVKRHMKMADRADRLEELRGDQTTLNQLAKQYGFKAPKLKEPK